MFEPSPMQKIRVLMSRKNLDAVLERLQYSGVVDITECSLKDLRDYTPEGERLSRALLSR